MDGSLDTSARAAIWWPSKPGPLEPSVRVQIAAEPSLRSHTAYVDRVAVPLDKSAVPLLVGSIARDDDWSARRAIVSILPDADRPDWRDVLLDGSEPAQQRLFPIYAPGGAPFSVGDVVGVRTRRVQVGGEAFDFAFAIVDGHDQMRAATFTDRATIGDWSVAGVNGAPCTIAVAHAGVRSVLTFGRWYRITAPDADWAVLVDTSHPCVPSPSPSSHLPPPIPPADWVPASIGIAITRL